MNVPGGLKVRSKPGIGVYVENLTPVAVSSYAEIERRMDEGTAARTVASTKMNATSSRAHTVFGINFTTITEADGAVSEMTARMNLVDCQCIWHAHTRTAFLHMCFHGLRRAWKRASAGDRFIHSLVFAPFLFCLSVRFPFLCSGRFRACRIDWCDG